jgi:hypothetical protein
MPRSSKCGCPWLKIPFREFSDEITANTASVSRKLRRKSQLLGADHPNTQQMQQNLDAMRPTTGRVTAKFDRLGGQKRATSDGRVELIRRAEAADKSALAAGIIKGRDAVAERLEVTAEAYAHGDVPDRALTDGLRILAARLGA